MPGSSCLCLVEWYHCAQVLLIVFLLSFNPTFKGSSSPTDAENCLDISMTARFLLFPPVFTKRLSDLESASSWRQENSRGGLSLLGIIHHSVSCLFTLTSWLERIHLCPLPMTVLPWSL